MTLAPPLPEVPTGHEFLDLIWSLRVPAADTYIAVLPPDADPRWASEAGMQFLSVSLLEARAAKEELRLTSRHSTLRRVRARRLRRLEKQFEGQALAVLGAITNQTRARHPQASAPQLLMATRDVFRALQSAVFPAGDVHRCHTPAAPATDAGDVQRRGRGSAQGR